MKSATEILKQYWGYDSFRPVQEDIVNSVIAGHDTLALLPTGGGKSICFQVPAMMAEGVCIVISPLIALMRDQVEQLKKRNIEASAIYSGLNKREIDIILDNCIYGKTKFLYVSPERLKTEIFLTRALKMNVSLLAIDEAHCISQWGYDFRPSYLEIAVFKNQLEKIPVIALTASATEQVRQDIVDKLEIPSVQIFRKSFARKNLSYSVFHIQQKEKKMIEILNNVPGSAIVYVSSRRKTIDTAIFLQKQGIRSTFYHGGLAGEDRMERQNEWIQNKVRVMVATNAFGMGIDKPDVRCVIHLDIPDSPEAYYQEAGRAGRDEKMAYAVLLYNKNDEESLEKRVKQSAVPVELLKRVYQSVSNHLKIAVGSHSMESFDINIAEMIRVFNLPGAETYFALKKLEEEGLLQLTETVFQRSKCYILVSRSELYQFQVANAKLDPIIKTILRLYGGELFTSFLPIKESDISKMLMMPVMEVVQKLTYLDQLKIVVYDHPGDKPRLTFLTPRQDASKLEIDRQKIEERNRIVLNKMNAQLKYLKNAIRCRTQQLQEYFDEVSYANCNICDNCLAMKKDKARDEDVTMLKKEIMSFVKREKINVFKLKDEVKPDDQYFFSEALRELMEEGKILLDLDMIVFR
ncbi:MAG: ATP-dependent DNA helicase RecQ [Cyclobacteriaceae bacterium]